MSPNAKTNLLVAGVFFAVGFLIGFTGWTPDIKDDRATHALKVGPALGITSLVASAVFFA